MAKKAKAKKDDAVESLESQFESQLESLGLGDALRLADEYDNDVEVVTTGFPGLDCAIDDRGLNPGVPKHRHLEIYSKKEHAGKAQPMDALIKVPTGWTKMGDLKVGDTVVSIDGKPSKIKGIYPQGRKPVFELEFSDGRKTRTCGEHLWKMTSTKTKQPRIISTYGLIEKTRHPHFNNHYYFPVVSGKFGHDQAVPINPWLLGVLLGDGTVTSGTPAVSSADKELLARIERVVAAKQCKLEHNANHDWRIVQANSRWQKGTQGVVENPYTTLLKELGLYGKDCYSKFIPSVYLHADRASRVALLQGLMDTDGTIDNRHCSTSFSTSSRQLAEDVQELVRSLGGLSNVTEKIPTYTYKGERRIGAISYTVRVRLESPKESFWLPRKKDKATDHRQCVPRLNLKSVRYVGEMETQCIAVTHPSQLYVTDQYIVTHNTSLALAIGLTWQELGYRVGIIDIEPSITKQYLLDLGFIVDKETAETQGKYAVRLLQPQIKAENCETDMIYLEKILDTVSKAADVFDFLIIDSVDALVSELEAEKAAADNEKAGGIAKKMRGWFRKNTTRRSVCCWLNHASVNIGGGYGPPSYYTSGGKTVPRYSSLRLELTVIEKLREGEKDPYGFVTRVQLVKNRLGPNWRYTDLHYLFGEGFSREYDYFRTAIKLGILKKFGGWFYFLGEGKNDDERKKNATWKCQGEVNAYRQLTGKTPETHTAHDAAVWAEIKQLIQGEDVSADVKIGDVDPDAEVLSREHGEVAET